MKSRMELIIITIQNKFQGGEIFKFAEVSEDQMLRFARFGTTRTIQNT